VPVATHAYAGNRPDVTQFATALSALRRQFEASDDQLTVVFDAGMDFSDNLAGCDHLKFLRLVQEIGRSRQCVPR
jgi:transposase